MSLSQKMSEVAAECGFAQFDNKNAHFNYKYASAAGVIRMVNKALTSRGIAVGTQSELLNYTVGDDGKTRHAVIRLTLRFTDGEDAIEAQGIGEGSDKTDKAIYKANTGAYKYALAHALAMAWGAEDPEASTETGESTAKPKTAAKKAPSARAKKATEPPPVLGRIQAAKDTAELEATKDDIRALKASDEKAYQEMRQAYLARESELKAA